MLLAGFSGVALLRSSLFTARVGDRDVAIGPAFALRAILDALDRVVDRKQALRRSQFLDALPHDPKLLKALPAVRFGLMQNASPEEQRAIGVQIESVVNNRALSYPDKFRLVCLQLLGLVGRDVLGAEVARLAAGSVGPAGGDGTDPIPDPPPPPEPDPDPAG